MIPRFLLRAFTSAANQKALDQDFLVATRTNDLDKMRELYHKGANPDAVHDGGWRASHWAAHDGKQEAFKLLRDMGADLRAKQNGGYDPYDLANKRITEFKEDRDQYIKTSDTYRNQAMRDGRMSGEHFNQIGQDILAKQNDIPDNVKGAYEILNISNSSPPSKEFQFKLFS
jgi:hypothetical protein